MNTPGIHMEQAETLEYGFLAVRAADAIQRKLDGHTLSSTDQEALQKAHEFLMDVVQGASLVSGSEFAGHSAQVVTALGFASHPVANLQAAITNNDEFSKFFEDLAAAIVATEIQQDTLRSANAFFELMVDSLRNAIGHSKAPSIGPFHRSTSELKYYG